MSDSLRVGPGDGFGEFACLSTGPDLKFPPHVCVRRAPYGIDLATRSNGVTGEFIRLTRSEVVRLAGMLAEFEIDPTNEAEGYRSKPPTP